MAQKVWIGVTIFCAYLFSSLTFNPVFAENQKSNRTYVNFKERNAFEDKQMMRTRYKQKEELSTKSNASNAQVNAEAIKDKSKVKPHTVYLKTPEHKIDSAPKTIRERKEEKKKELELNPPQTVSKVPNPITTTVPPPTTIFSPGKRSKSRLNKMIQDLQRKND